MYFKYIDKLSYHTPNNKHISILNTQIYQHELVNTLTNNISSVFNNI